MDRKSSAAHDWTNRRILVTGGASCIGSHLVDALVARGAKVRVVDDLTSGKVENVGHHLTKGSIELIEADLREPGVTRMAVQGMDLVFHLAADHGGRGYVDDIVEGTILAAEKIDDGTAVNLGTIERIRVLDAVEMVLRMVGHKAKIVTCPDMPTGPLNSVADNSLAKKLLGWGPKFAFRDGLRCTIDWFLATKDRNEVRRMLENGALTERKAQSGEKRAEIRGHALG